MKRVAIILAMFLLSACMGATPTSAPQKELYEEKQISKYVYRMHDDQTKVTCWIYLGYQSGAISCITDTQLSIR